MDNRVFYHKFQKMEEDKNHYYKKAYIYIISQDPKTLRKGAKLLYKVGLTKDNILRRLADYQICYREFLVHGLYQFPYDDIETAEKAIHKQIEDTVFYKKYVKAGTVYDEVARVKTNSGYVNRKVGTLKARKDGLIDDFKQPTEWVSCSLDEIYDAIRIVLRDDPKLNTITAYKMNQTKIVELRKYNMPQPDRSFYITKRGTRHTKANNTVKEYRKGHEYNVIYPDNNKAHKNSRY